MSELIWIAVGLWLIFEGFMPFASPRAFRQTLQKISELSDNAIRWAGFFMINLGALIIYLLK